jgi:hypothetical protein
VEVAVSSSDRVPKRTFGMERLRQPARPEEREGHQDSAQLLVNVIG